MFKFENIIVSLTQDSEILYSLSITIPRENIVNKKIAKKSKE